VPDIVTLAKGLGGGLPIGACIAIGSSADALRKGDHGSTFGGNPISCSAALAVIDTIEKEDLLTHVSTLGAAWSQELRAAGGEDVRAVRGRGLWLAMALDEGLSPHVEAAAREAGFIVNAVAPDAIRLAPPLVLTDDEAGSFAAALPGILRIAGAAASVDAVPADRRR
jgi:acetylornithine/N-succinyldiaminopimelate aminotransferase